MADIHDDSKQDVWPKPTVYIDEMADVKGRRIP